MYSKSVTLIMNSVIDQSITKFTQCLLTKILFHWYLLQHMVLTMAVLKQLELSVRYQNLSCSITCSIVFFVSATSCLSLPFTRLCFIRVITNCTVILTSIMLLVRTVPVKLYLYRVSFVDSQNHSIALLVSFSILFAFFHIF